MATSEYVVSDLLSALLQPDLHRHLKPSVVLRACNRDLFRSLPLLLAAVQRVGETPGRRTAFSNLARALRTRVSICRAAKLRMLLLCSTPGFGTFWDVKIVHRAQCYDAAREKLAESLAALEGDEQEDGASDDNGSVDEEALAGDSLDYSESSHQALQGDIKASALAVDLLNDSKKLISFSRTVLFAEKGVPLRDHTRHLTVRENTFLASELVDTIMELVNFSERTDALKIGRRMQSLGLITKVGRPKKIADNDKLWFFNSKDFDLESNRVGSSKYIHREGMGFEDELRNFVSPPFAMSELMVACDDIDLQGFDFWRDSIFSKKQTTGDVFSYQLLPSPMAWAKSASSHFSSGYMVENDSISTIEEASPLYAVSRAVDDMEVDTSEVLDVISSVKVLKVFSSIARPMIVQMSVLGEGSIFGSDEGRKVVDDLLLVKEGDNLGQDLCVELLFRGFNAIWSSSPTIFTDPSKTPFAYPYVVFPTGPTQGFMQVIPDLKSLKDFDWDNWVSTRGKDEDAVDRMIYTAAGSYVGAYIVGAGDRHTENVQIQDNFTLIHIDFGFVLGKMPPIDGPQISIYPEMEAAFLAVGAWDRFVDACQKAFIAVRRCAPTVIRTSLSLFVKFGFEAQMVRDYLTGPDSLNTRESCERMAAAKIGNLVRQSSQNWKTKLKGYSHEKIDPAFYSLLEKRFPPAVLAMKIVDSKQQGASHKLKMQCSIDDPVPAFHKASIDEEC